MRRLIALLCALPIVLAACGGDDAEKPAATPASSSGQSGQTLDLTAEEPGDEQFAFSKKTLTAKTGAVTLHLTLPGSGKAPHGIAIEGNGIDKDGPIAQPGGTSEITADLKPGTYTFYCPVGDHREEGMEGTLTVQ